MTPGVEKTTAPDSVGSPDKLYQTAKKPATAANDSMLLSAGGHQKRNMTGTRFMGSTGSAFHKPMGWFTSAVGSTAGSKV